VRVNHPYAALFSAVACLCVFWWNSIAAGQATPFDQDAAATAHSQATETAMEIYRQGGNAVDAAVAAAFALAVVEPHNSGLGGGGFLLFYSAKDRRLHALDYRETAPALAARHVYQGAETTEGWRAMAVPGMLAGLTIALSEYGTKPLSEILGPAIRLAEKGFEATPILAEEIAERVGCLGKFPATREVFLPGGRPPRAGERLIQRDLARTLHIIAEKGPDVFYRGEIADRIEKAAEASGGFLRRRDLAGYSTKRRDPVRFGYRGFEIASMGLPSSGGILMKAMFADLERRPAGSFEWGSIEEAEALTGRMKEAFRGRVFLGDPDFARFKTTHATFADRFGNVVSMTNSLNQPFGSCVVVPGLGLLMNDHMDDFAARPGEPNAFGLIQGEANRIEAGKRPLSSMSPTIVLKGGRPVYALGSPGGPTIISNVFQTIVNLIDHGMSLEQAVAAPKLHHQFGPDVLSVQPGYPTLTKAKLKMRGVTLKEWSWGNLQAVSLDFKRRRLTPVSDPRGQGRAEAE
jgi:gamma-glutamyltranspeptidase/glutathione hydrolase